MHGFSSKLANDQVAFIILEGGIIIVATFLLTALHPGVYIGPQWRESGWGVKKARKPIALQSDSEPGSEHLQLWPLPI